MPKKKFDPEKVKVAVAKRVDRSKPTTSEGDRLRWEALRELALRSLHEFVRQAWHVIEPETNFVDGWHIRAICDHLEAVTAGRVPQLLINVPPGTMKSLLVGVFWPAWVWTREPGKRFMYSSYSENLSIRDSIKTRTLVQSEWYQERWPTMLGKEMETRLDNDRGGWRIVGSITGKGIGEHPDFNVADDPHNVLQAESDADRQRVTRWFEGVFCVRGEVRDVRRVLVMQRLHAMDCSGVAMSKGAWTHLCLPMRYEVDHPNACTAARPTSIGFADPRTVDGDLLWPAVYTAEKVANMEINLGTYVAAGQLQQRPSPRGGGMFRRAWFTILADVPAGIVQIIRYWDKAGTKGGTGAETATVLMAKYSCPNEKLPAMREKFVILEADAYRVGSAERETIIGQKAATDRSKWGYVETWVEEEPGSGGKESAEGTIANNPGYTFKAEKVTGSKDVRAEPLASQASVGKVALLVGPWNEKLLGELEMFPMGKIKDLVDGSSGAFNKLYKGSGAFGSASELTTNSRAMRDADGVEPTMIDIRRDDFF